MKSLEKKMILSVFAVLLAAGCTEGDAPAGADAGTTDADTDSDTDSDSDSDSDSDPCDGVDCGDNGECVDNEGTAECDCDDGYQDNDGDLTCEPDCDTAALDCGDNGECDDSSGTALCLCDEGWDGDLCDECAAGYQDNDTNDTCEPACGSLFDCGGHGTCDDTSGFAICTCDPGYTGDNCELCDTGYQDNDTNDTCEPSCDAVDCGGHGTCEDTSGFAICTCDAGYQDNDLNLTCLPDCATTGLDCGPNGECDDSDGTVGCDCDEGYQDNGYEGYCTADCATASLVCGPNEECDDSSGDPVCACASGYQDNDDNDSCLPDCTTAGLTCSGHGECDDGSGTAVCDCDEGYVGADCEACAAGYQDNDGNDSCYPDCATAALDCGVYGACDDTGGTAICVCDEGHAGPSCETCDIGYQDNDDNGTCLIDCVTAALDCGDHGVCDDSDGLADCHCEVGYIGEFCDGCDVGYVDLGGGDCGPDCTSVVCGYGGVCDDSGSETVCNCLTGYQDNDSNLTCEPDCATAAPICGTNEVCDDSGGIAICVCEPGYQDNDNDTICQPDCITAALDCGDHGSCDDSGGLAVCACDEGYIGALCDTCDVGYQDNDNDTVCELDCLSADLDCSDHGQCIDTFGSATCVCEIGYGGSSCDACDTGYQDNDDDDTCLPDCELDGLECGDFSLCDDSSGFPECVCEPYYQDYDNDWTCEPKCAIAGLSCPLNASCDDSSGTPTCECHYGYQDNDDNDSCLPNCLGVDCGPQGACDDDSGQAQCICDPGYQDNDDDLSCLANCATAALGCSGHGSCDDSGGEAVCVCDTEYDGPSCASCAAGYQDNDSNSTCNANCATAALVCPSNASCSDGSGTAECVCDAGYQDNDSNDSCLPNCATAALDCSGHGVCDDSDGTPGCVCDAGYVGAACDSCDFGYQDNDDNGTCLVDCANSGLTCSGNGSCDDSGGTAVCVCDIGWTDANCTACATGYTWDGFDCTSDCASVTCSGLGTCGTVGETTVCNCNAGYQDNDGNLTCEPDCGTAALSCGPDTFCDDSSGTAQCVCSAGYQDNDDNGTCEADCATAALDCGDNGWCDDGSGTAVCACDLGYAGPACENCDIGWQDNDTDTICMPDCGTAALGCVYGTCDDSLGEAECVCDTGYQGFLCDACEAGYQDNDSNTTCLPDCATAAPDCGDHGVCDDSDGLADCACDTGYAGPSCASCAAGYQDNDTDTICLPNCATSGITCSGHGSCTDSDGTAGCICDAGYQDHDDNGTCTLTCNFAALECDTNEHCDDGSGTASCVCDAGYQDHDQDDTCKVDCTQSNIDCGEHGVCEDVIGRTICDCDAGYGGELCNWDLLRDLVFHFELDGDLTDSSVNNYLAVAFGTLSYVADPFGDQSALYLDGASNMVLDAGIQGDLDAIDEGSFSLWVRFDSLADSQTIVDFGNSSQSTGIARAGLTSALDFWIGANAIQGGAVTDGQWFHLVATVGAGGMKLYVNALLAASSATYTGPMFPSAGSTYMLGRSTNNTTPAHTHGGLDDVRLFDRELTAFEAASLFAEGFFRHRTAADWDGDGILNDGNSSGVMGDYNCPVGVTAACDDNNRLWPNPTQLSVGCGGADCTWEIAGCDPPWELTDTGNLYWYCPVLGSASDAALLCAGANTHLATISDQDEDDLVWQMIGDDAWIGANDLTNEGTWEWINGEPFGYQGWELGEPDDAFGQEDCAAVYAVTGLWHDRYCELDYDAVCEYSF